MNEHEVDLPCDAPDEALTFLVDRLGFRPERIVPADDPAYAVVSGHGLRLHLRRGSEPTTEVGTLPFETVVHRAPKAFQPGRAGMLYRDLAPDRFGGHWIASQIRIPEGGPVPDRVHAHEVEFQLIHCLAGWVEVAYEGQGEPVVLRPGDGVLQPPGLRHRVLQASDGLEVFELTGPAVHPTIFDPELELPGDHQPLGTWGGQRFVHYSAGADVGESFDTGIRAATGGRFDVQLLRGALEPLIRDARILYALAGDGTWGGERLAAGDLVFLPGGCAAAAAGDLAWLQLTW
ncbi:MAG: cupin domain-containing protein [Planctomycetota bacterium]|nr:cupin domain-containing protein [Planctomycetota bacterium]